ncbi:hypothetical protein F9C07_2063902 [Aspergillus flavus]|uniref:Protein kinase domain-containing protein n=1 Tax=Aspergillus flavus (strain ATCC 200026 / FGSC A1120 / IAM 13836 / NRRL 3357 / JCM 12722 / SRRC 167) TaxID=332952 RepID=A0A7G5JPI5_ASPFN|nr:uncharacterized protein G4B84_010477 [Aspergillus flavus NRRL3357]QMW34986.1 hypothetical protein G4B84_010477 [Aspergillus flavus NRRL3357]QMW37527.1 hypothetical protein G4B11_000763 [Aspergillus flavus]QRD91341.1 hypothetical protein F9C07_2063902 [Aspergillus flavus]
MKPNSDKRSTRIELDGIFVSNPPINESLPPVSSPPRGDEKGKEAPQSTGRLTKRGASPSSPEPGRKILRGPPRALTLSKIDEAGEAAGSDPVVRNEAPWKTFKKSYDCDLAGKVTVCTRQSGRRGPWTIRQYPGEDAERMLSLLRSIRHLRVASVLECFRTPDSLYTISRFYPLTLDHIVACKAFPNDQQLAAIMSQFVDGLSYLVSNNLHNPSLDSSDILMDLEGNIQIARLDSFSKRPPGRIQEKDLFPVARVLMQLMQKYAKDDGAIGLDKIDRWPADSAALEFLSATTSAGSFEGLKKRLLSKVPWSPGDLIGLAWFALISTRTFYSYVPESDKKRNSL